jgi:hypothetical protein
VLHRSSQRVRVRVSGRHVTAAAPINLSHTDARRPFDRQVVDNFFGYASMVEALDHHLRRLEAEPGLPVSLDAATLGPWLVDWLSSLQRHAEAARAEGRGPAVVTMFPLAMAIAYERTGDAGYLGTATAALRQLIRDDPWWLRPPDQCKAAAMLHRGLTRFLGAASRAGLLREFD